MISSAPSSAPPWCDIQNFEIWNVNIKWNQKTWFLDTYSCFYDYIRIHMRIFAILSIWELIWDVQNFSPNSKNRWFLGITFNATVGSLDMWYEYNFFDARQIRCKICRKMMIQYGGAYGGALCKRWFTTKSYFLHGNLAYK